MSEEEIEAIKELRMMKEINLSFTSYAWCNGNVRLSEGQKHTIDTILNLIKKQQKEIEKISSENYIGKRQYERQVNDYEELNQENIANKNEIEELKKYETYYKEQNEVNKEFIPKQKIKDKIEEYKKMYESLSKNPKEHLHSKTEYLIVIGVLKELLEED